MFKTVLNNLPLAIITLLSLFIIWPLFLPGFFPHHDNIQTIRIFEMRRCFSDLQIPCRWVPDMGYGYGFPMYNYYSAFPYYLAGFLSYFLGILGAAKALFFIPLAAAGFTMYFLVKELFGKKAGFVAGVLYLFAPYRALDAYVRGAIAESFAIALVPLVFYFCLKLVKNPDSKNLLLFVFALAAFLTTHNLMTMIFLPLILIWASYWLYKEKLKTVKPVIAGFIFGFGLAAFFLIPAFFERDLVHIENLLESEYVPNFRAHFVTLRQLLLDRSWGYGASTWGEDDGISFQIGWPHWWLTLISFLAALVWVAKKIYIDSKNIFRALNIYHTILIFSVLFIASIFMTHNKSAFIWELLPFLHYTQFPWRFLSLAIFFTSILGGIFIYFAEKSIIRLISAKLTEKLTLILLFLITISTVFFNWQYFKPEFFNYNINEEKLLSGSDWEFQKRGSAADYLPKSANLPKEIAPDIPEVVTGKAIVNNFVNKSNRWKFNITTNDTATINVPVFDFPNWRVFVNGNIIEHNRSEGLGVIEFELEKGSYTVEGKLHDTPIRTAANLTTLISLLFLFFLISGKKFFKNILKVLGIMAVLFVYSAVLFPTKVNAEEVDSYISIVNPIRGEDFWEQGNQDIITSVKGQSRILKENLLPATWLIRFDALRNDDLIKIVNSFSAKDELGIFLEVTPSWTQKSGVKYHKSKSWHYAGSVLLTGYSQADRERLINTAFAEFKSLFGYYPKSVGAWYIDSYSLSYMQKKFGIISALIVADQYTTDGYQVWGQYFGYPFYPSTQNTLVPAQGNDNKIPVVVMQWAARDPINGYGDGVQESTYSVQPNDYIDYHNLDINYFSRLIDVYVKQKYNLINQIVVGLENSYSWQSYNSEYRNQIEILAKKQDKGVLRVMNMKDFAGIYSKKFPDISPRQIIVTDDPLGTGKKVVWFMNPFYRAGWFFDLNTSTFRDIRQYVVGEKEPCFESICEEINFAYITTRVLDDITYKQKLVLDKGNIFNFKIKDTPGEFRLMYENEAGAVKEISFLTRDLKIGSDIKSIDAIILETQQNKAVGKTSIFQINQQLFDIYKTGVLTLIFNSFKFILFVFLGLFIPAFLLISRVKELNLAIKIFLSVTTGFSIITLLGFFTGIFRLDFLLPFFIFIFIAIFFFLGKYQDLKFKLRRPKFSELLLVFLILLGTFFQSYGAVKSGQVYKYGIGFWGPTGHDFVWHQALINQLVSSTPPQNPILSGAPFTNYHYFYDILVAQTHKYTLIPIDDLIYRFYPVVFSILIGIGVYLFALRVFNSRVGATLAVFFAYFGSSFGFIVTLIKGGGLWGGESAFWANQPVSFNLNPPFAISILLFIAGLLLLFEFLKKKNHTMSLLVPLILILGSLMEFKVYGGVIVIVSLGLVTVIQIIQRDFSLLKVTLPVAVLSLVLFLYHNLNSVSLLQINPFWFIHTMVDFHDRVGWEKLSLARQAYFDTGNWMKLFIVEGLAFLIFVIGNLGTRIIAVVKTKDLFHKKTLTDPFNQFVLLACLIPLLIVLTFVQAGNPWNIIQFSYYPIFIFSILAAVALAHMVKTLPKKAGLVIVVVVLLITPLSSIATFKGYGVSQAHAVIPINELEGLYFLRDLPDGVVLTYPFDKETRSLFEEPFPLFAYDTTSYVSAYTTKTTFVEDEQQQQIFQSDYKTRLSKASEFFKTDDREWAINFLETEKIKYIYLPKALNISIDSQKLGLVEIFNNSSVKVYERI